MRVLCLLAALSFVTAASGQTVPAQISYQGYLELNGAPVSGSVDLVFNLYTQATGGFALWTETQTGVSVDAGVYQVALGSVANLPSGAFDAALWLGVSIDGSGELTPRTALLPAPYALGLQLPFAAPSNGDGIVIERAGTPTSTNSSSESNAFQVNGAEGNGLYVGQADRNGVRVLRAGTPSTAFVRISGNGFEINGAEGNGLYVGRADREAIRVSSAGVDGVRIDRAGTPSADFSDSASNGFEINGAEGSGLSVGRADMHGVRVRSAGMDGLLVEGAGRYGAYIQSTPSTNDGNLTTSYVAYVDNTGSSTSSDVLALQVAPTSNPSNGANFIAFFDGGGTVVGEIDGNGAGGVQYKSTGADYAEYLPIAGCSSSACGLDAGTVVGVKAGKVSLTTEGADEVLVVSTQPAVVGNAPQGESTEGFAAIAMLGQADVRVVGSVDAGDYVLASGRGDGTAVAVPAGEITPEMLNRLIGRAWSTKPGAGEGTVNVAVGLNRTEVLSDLLRAERERNEQQEHEIDDLRKQNSQQQHELDELRRMIEALAAR
ncbi:MAG: hypothetical protein AAGI08_05755 [Bacteroidota bacterium]